MSLGVKDVVLWRRRIIRPRPRKAISTTIKYPGDYIASFYTRLTCTINNVVSTGRYCYVNATALEDVVLMAAWN